jgi:hypothetical protein
MTLGDNGHAAATPSARHSRDRGSGEEALPHDSEVGLKRAIVEMPPSYDAEVRGAPLCCLFALRLGNANAFHSCRRV